eukprot:Gb_24362 [translate_table: standard]
MPSGSKKRKAAKKKKETGLHVQTASNASHENSGNGHQHEHEDDALVPKTPIQASETDEKNSSSDAETGSPTYRTKGSKQEAFAQDYPQENHTQTSFTDVREHYPKKNIDISIENPSGTSEYIGGDESRLEASSSEAVLDKHGSTENLGSEELTGFIQNLSSQEFPGKASSEGAVVRTSGEREHESKTLLEASFQGINSETNTEKVEPASLQVSVDHVDAIEVLHDQEGHAMDDSSTGTRLDVEANTQSKEEVMEDFRIEVQLTDEVGSTNHADNASVGDRFNISGSKIEETHLASSVSSVAASTEGEATDTGEENPIQVNVEVGSDNREDHVLFGERSNESVNKLDETGIVSSVSSDVSDTEREASVTGELAVPLSKTESTKQRVQPGLSTGEEVIRDDLEPSQVIVKSASTSLNEKAKEVALHSQNAGNEKAMSFQREAPTSWKSCCGMLEIFTGSRT